MLHPIRRVSAPAVSLHERGKASGASEDAADPNTRLDLLFARPVRRFSPKPGIFVDEALDASHLAVTCVIDNG